jgi:hypothetical protein
MTKSQSFDEGYPTSEEMNAAIQKGYVLHYQNKYLARRKSTPLDTQYELTRDVLPELYASFHSEDVTLTKTNVGE